MALIEVQLSTTRLTQRLAQFLATATEETERVVADVAATVKTDVQAGWPVDSGASRAGGHSHRKLHRWRTRSVIRLGIASLLSTDYTPIQVRRQHISQGRGCWEAWLLSLESFRIKLQLPRYAVHLQKAMENFRKE